MLAVSKAISGKSTGSYGYRADACNASGCSAFRVSAGGVAVTITPASAPSHSVPTTSSTGNYTVSWAAISEKGVRFIY